LNHEIRKLIYTGSLLCAAETFSPLRFFVSLDGIDAWSGTLSFGALVEYPEMQNPLGPPMGPYQRTTPDG
jgi:hypothetical protein